MRSLALHIILIAYGFLLVKPVMPVVSDAWAHVFDLVNHIASVHYENGKYHVHEELAEESSSNETADDKLIEKQFQQPDLFLTCTHLNHSVFIFSRINFHLYPDSLTMGVKKSEDRPPLTDDHV